jgi:hypothetical protein
MKVPQATKGEVILSTDDPDQKSRCARIFINDCGHLDQPPNSLAS